MKCKNYQKAYEIFKSCIDYYPDDPKIWLLMGESKIAIYHENLIDSNNDVKRKFYSE